MTTPANSQPSRRRQVPLARAAVPCIALLLQSALITHAAADPQVADYSVPPTMQVAGSYDWQPDASKIAPFGRYVYCLVKGANPDHIAITHWDPDGAPEFTLVGTFAISVPTISDMVVAGPYLCVSYVQTTAKTNVYSLNDPTAPLLVDTFSAPAQGPLSQMTPIAYADGTARYIGKVLWDDYIHDSEYRINLYAIDPSTHQLSISSNYVTTWTTYDLAAVNTNVYEAYAITPVSYAARGVDWRTPSQPVVTAPYSLAAAPRCIAATSVLQRMVVSYQYPMGNVWTAVAISDAAVIGPTTTLDNAVQTTEQLYCYPFLLRGVGDVLKLRLYEASIPDEDPILCDANNISESPDQMVAIGDTIFSRTASRMDALVIEQPHPIGAAEHPLGEATDVVSYKAVGGALPITYVSGADGVRAFYTSCPPACPAGAPAMVPGVSLLQGSPVSGLSISDSDLLVACSGSTVFTFQIGDTPDAPEVYKAVGLSQGTAEKAVILGGKLYVASGTGGLRIYNMPATENGNITFWRSCSTTGDAIDVVVQRKGTYTLAYVAEGTSGIEIFRTDDAYGITRRGGLDTEMARRLAIRGTVLYVADATAGVAIIDVGTPTAPALLGALSGANVTDISISGNECYALDGQLVRVYNIADPESPVRRWFMNAGSFADALDASNRLWLAEEDELMVGYMQQASAPSVAPGTPRADVYLDVETNFMTWEFSWRTLEWTDPDFLEVVVRNADTPLSGCLDFGTTGTAVGYGDSGVTTSVRPSRDGGWLNTVRWDAGYCVEACNYAFKGRCVIEADGMEYAETAEVAFTAAVCLEIGD